ncbi:hypothetical protein CQ018_01050 [Arthrobacter sp. MYb227]|uniref:hypothetical protein n=1 Tax=Arthrobacter sp. MYb227 TaxID=1848601 RepID=UPI000CFC2511|nr:hypothetical protein [Arthrobacter sp. MYb227]PQZ95916.1 hypothetical protein CQ018_01050 [Arthrobacter sp. MYb227]
MQDGIYAAADARCIKMLRNKLIKILPGALGFGRTWILGAASAKLGCMEANPNFVSIARADSQAGLILKAVAGIVLLTGVLMAGVAGAESIGQTLLILGINLVVALGIFLLPKTFITRSEITETQIRIETMKIFRATLPTAGVLRAFSDPGLFTGGYGLRSVGRGHRAYISGGEQVTIEMHDGRIFTLSVESADKFLAELAHVRAVHEGLSSELK